MHHENTNLLSEVSYAAKMGTDAIEILLPKIKNDGLRQELKDQRAQYRRMQTEANTALARYQMRPKTVKPMQHMMLWSSIQMNTMMNTSEQHIAELMINGTTMGIIDMTKKLNALEHPNADERKLAQAFLNHSQDYIDMWKHYL